MCEFTVSHNLAKICTFRLASINRPIDGQQSLAFCIQIVPANMEAIIALTTTFISLCELLLILVES